jgi:alpha-methylacyl-CoA racemase
MLLSDLGAEVLRIDRIVPSESGVKLQQQFNLLHRGRKSVAMDLKRPEAVGLVKKLIVEADVLVEGFRPGVAERLGLGPEVCHAINNRLVYGRMTGWGQDGPLAQAPGHDINYIALSGVLHAIGQRGGPPIPPLNLIGDFGGGGLYLALGILGALFERHQSGLGQVIDASMAEGSASLMTFFYGLRAAGSYSDQRGANRYDGGAPYYNVYETSDARYVALGSNEPNFYRNTLELLGLMDKDLPDQNDRAAWPEMRERFAAKFKTKTREEWCDLASRHEVCLSPVLSIDEAPDHPHNTSRKSFVEIDGVKQPAPAPRFSRTPTKIRSGAPEPGQHSREALVDWGVAESEVSELIAAGVIRQA